MKRNYDFSKGAVIKGPVKSRSEVEKALKDQQKTLTSIRLDKDVIEVAKRKASRAQLEAFFDVVISRLVIHHLPDDLKQRGFAEVFRADTFCIPPGN